MLSIPYFDELEEESVEPYQPGRGLTEYVLRTGKSLLCDVPRHEELAASGEVEYVGPISQIWLGVPLLVENEIIGVMAVQHYTDPNAYTVRDQYILEFVSSQIAQAIIHKQSDQALRDSETRFRSLSDLSPVGVFEADLEGRGTYVNDTVCR